MDEKPSKFREFLNFDIKITPIIMKWFYVIGSALIILGGILYIFTMFIGGIGMITSDQVGAGILMILGGPILVIIGIIVNLVIFRIACEWLIVFFSMHKELRDLNNKG
ncbi:MAG: DUF4282 domain-containing protein [Defluviitaleaceae bacterium]|nr:DUF4282 domain-containing protein [Defluviitaleaceae bacterium]